MLASPLVATAGDVSFGDLPPVQATLVRLSEACPVLAGGVDFPTMLSLQAFYEQNAG
ncbi:murein L,D-transpeptidase, partial [Pseudomonas corrugata]|nr:murein L,D-transpeptidase [Pseudomonas corrugata]